MKNRRSLLVNRTRPRTVRCSTVSCCRSAAFSASSRLLDLKSEATKFNNRNISAAIVADVRRFYYEIIRTRFLVRTAAIKRKIASIECADALILPHRANPTGSDFRERQVATYLKVAWQQILRAFVTTPIDFDCGCVESVHG